MFSNEAKSILESCNVVRKNLNKKNNRSSNKSAIMKI